MRKIYSATLLLGVYLSSANLKAQIPTFNQDVAPIIYKNCASCHNPNGINSSLPFTSYSEIVDDSSAIRVDLVTSHMPPWPPDTTYTKFMHDRSLKIADKNKILSWLNAGAPEGTGSAPACPSYKPTHRLAGKSSLTVGVGKITSNSVGTNGTAANPYNCYVLPLKLTEGKWLRAVEIVPGNLKAVHHVVLTIDTTYTAKNQVDGACNSQPGQFGIGGWSSGASPVVYPNKAPFKAGQYLPKGSAVVAQIHFAPGSGGEIDSTKVRLYFYDNADTAGIRPVHDEVILQNWNFTIAANSISTVTAISGSFNPSNPFKPLNQPSTDFSVIATNPHSHFVCTKIKNYAYGTKAGLPDTIQLIRMNNWDYHWQGYYYHPKPIKVPVGYTLKSEHIYNNTSGNLHLLTDPNNSVSAGTATEQEMLFDDFLWASYRSGDEFINMDSLLQGDPIFSTGLEAQPYEPTLLGIESVSENILSDYISISPNPASDRMKITIEGQEEYTGNVYNITGQIIVRTDVFKNSTVLDVSNVPAGIYFLEVVNNKTNERTAKKLMVNH